MVQNFMYLQFILIMMLIYKFMNNLLMLLISLEFMVIFMLMYLLMMKVLYNDWIFIYILILMVNDGIIGISLMVNLIQLKGKENMELVNLIW